MSPVPHRKQGEAGFTLLEALVALTVLAVCLSAIGGLAGSSLRIGKSFERHIIDVATLREILAGLPARGANAAGGTSGTLDGETWHVAVAPYRPTFLDAKAQHTWVAETIAVRTQSPNGATLEVDSVRLRKSR